MKDKFGHDLRVGDEIGRIHNQENERCERGTVTEIDIYDQHLDIEWNATSNILRGRGNYGAIIVGEYFVKLDTPEGIMFVLSLETK